MAGISGKGTAGKGRKKGIPNKLTIDLIEKAAKLKCDPFEILCLFANKDWKALGYKAGTETKCTQTGQTYEVELISPELRVNAAKEAAKYMYPVRKAVDVTSNNERVSAVSVVTSETADKVLAALEIMNAKPRR